MWCTYKKKWSYIFQILIACSCHIHLRLFNWPAEKIEEFPGGAEVKESACNVGDLRR